MVPTKQVAAVLVIPIALIGLAVPAAAAPTARCTKVAPTSHDAYGRCVALAAQGTPNKAMKWHSRLAGSVPRNLY